MWVGRTYGEDGVADIVRDDEREGKMGHVRHVDERNGRQRNHVVRAHDCVVGSFLLQRQKGDQGLLDPIGRMNEIEDLEGGVVGLVREAVKEAGHVEEPDGGPLHDV